MQTLLGWCQDVLGAFEIVSDDSREHPGEPAKSYRLRTPAGGFFVKTHRDPANWAAEVHGYERWAPVFGEHAPRLAAVREEPPLAIIVSELPGRVLEGLALPPEQERAAWRSAGQALVALHGLETGESFGPCRRDGSPAGRPVRDSQEYILAELADLVERGQRIACLEASHLALVAAARGLVPAFAGVRPTPCHRDYCPPNWLVAPDGSWSGVIDFEFAYWDVPSADFTRYPNWDWIQRPDLADAFFEGYGPLTAQQEQQRLVSHVIYALAAVVWGMENAYYGFAAEGRAAFHHLAQMIGK